MSHPGLENMLLQLAARFTGKASGPKAMGERIPASNYTDTTHFERERNQLFLRKPLVLAHESQIPEPGDAIVQDWLGLPLITLRDKAGDIGTFMNVCRHRGMRLVQDEGQTCLRSLVCPYHQWTYGLDGQLRSIPRRETFSELDTDTLGLVAIPTAVRNGLIWIQGAFLDGYHVTRLHKNTVGPFFPDALADSEFIGDHLRNAVARNEIDEGVFAPEDVFVAVGAQRGLKSGANDSLLFGGLEEAAIRFHQRIEERLSENSQERVPR